MLSPNIKKFCAFRMQTIFFGNLIVGLIHRKSRQDRDIKLNKDISLGWEVAPPGRKGWAGRAG